MSEILRDYFEQHHSTHQAEISRRSTVQGRMEEALERSDGTPADSFFRFFKEEVMDGATSSGRCLVYMPDFGINESKNKGKGKIIIEVDAPDTPLTLTKDCFELQFAHKTELRKVRVQTLKSPSRYPSDDSVVRYYNMFLHWDDAIPLVQRVLFCSLFRQRFLMTTQSRVLGSITTQRFVSDIGHVLSFRACVLKE